MNVKESLSRFSPPIIIYGLIYYLSSRPAASFPDVVPDVVPHFIEYGILAFFFMRMVFYRRSPETGMTVAGVAVLFLLALLDEWHQFYVPTRFFQLKDIVVDGMGVVAGTVAYGWWSVRGKGWATKIQERMGQKSGE